jgi:hypothetical protein
MEDISMGAAHPARPADAEAPMALRDDARRLVTLLLAASAVYFTLAGYTVVLLDRYEGRYVDDFAVQGLAVIGIAQALLYLAGGVQWALWLRGAILRLRAAGRTLQVTPGMAIAWYFIPFANLFMPLKVMQELWRASSDAEDWQHAPVSRLVNVWWPLFIGGNLVTGIGVALSAGGERVPYFIGLGVGALLVAVAGVLAVLFIRQLEARMPQMAAERSAPPAPAPIAPLREPIAPLVAAAPLEPAIPAESPAAAPAPAEAAAFPGMKPYGSRIGGERLGPKQAASWMKLLNNPAAQICPSCHMLGKPASKPAALMSAAGIFLSVPIAMVVGSLLFGAEAIQDNSLFLSIAWFVAMGIAWGTAKSGWNHACQRCGKAALVPLPDQLRAEMIAEVQEKAARASSGGEGGAR